MQMTITIFISFDIMSLYTVNKRKQIKRIPILFYGKLHINMSHTKVKHFYIN